MTTELLYLLPSPPLNVETTITATGDEGGRAWIAVDKVTMHPQGGGQPADHGVVAGREVLHVAKDGDSIRYYLNPDHGLGSGDVVSVAVDPAVRLRNARWHTGGHFIAAVLESAAPEYRAFRAHHWVGQARVELAGPEPSEVFSKGDLAGAVQEWVDRVAREARPVEIRVCDGIRQVQIGDFAPVPCGGTHVGSTSEIGPVRIRKVKFTDGTLVVGYALEEL